MNDREGQTPPILAHKHPDEPFAFTPESLLREARRQKGAEAVAVPKVYRGAHAVTATCPGDRRAFGSGCQSHQYVACRRIFAERFGLAGHVGVRGRHG